MYTLGQKKQYFICQNLSFSKQEQKEIWKYFKSVLHELDWVETDLLKIEYLLNPFFNSSYVHNENKMIVSKKVIALFYVLRTRLDVCDEEIRNSILNCFVRNHGLFIEHLEDELFSYWKGKLCN